MTSPNHSEFLNSLYRKLGIDKRPGKKVFFDGGLKFAKKPFVSLVPSRVKILQPGSIKTPMEIVHKFHKKRSTMPAMAKELKNLDILEPMQGRIYGIEMESKLLNEQFDKAICKMRKSVFLTTGSQKKLFEEKNKLKASKSLIGKRLKF